jgi:hypothetical protein
VSQACSHFLNLLKSSGQTVAAFENYVAPCFATTYLYLLVPTFYVKLDS